MTEFEINKKVAEKLGFQAEIRENGTWIFNPIWFYFDPCNDVSQAWEIMLKYNICVTKGFEYFEAFQNLRIDDNWKSDACIVKMHKKPLVAAMLCFLEF